MSGDNRRITSQPSRLIEWREGVKRRSINKVWGRYCIWDTRHYNIKVWCLISTKTIAKIWSPLTNCPIASLLAPPGPDSWTIMGHDSCAVLSTTRWKLEFNNWIREFDLFVWEDTWERQKARQIKQRRSHDTLNYSTLYRNDKVNV